MMSPGTTFTSAGRGYREEQELLLTSLGIDIGSTTTHVVFSRIRLEWRGSRFVPIKRTVLHESEVLLTPYLDELSIDAQAVGDFIAYQYGLIGLENDQVDTGAVILTGLAARRENARSIGELFARESGRFVVVTAGDALEATLTAHGSGVAHASAVTGQRILCIDVGGGTSKISLSEGGRVTAVTALDVGARLIVLAPDGTVLSLEAEGERFAAQAGVSVQPGQPTTPEDLRAIARPMVDRLFEAAGLAPLTPEARELLRIAPLTAPVEFDALAFSGGVSEYIYDRETQPHGDLGLALAEEIKSRLPDMPVALLQGRQLEGIRATVLGASQYTLQMSGNTIFASPVERLPIFNIPVIDIGVFPSGTRDAERGVRQAIEGLGLLQNPAPVAVNFGWEGEFSLAGLDQLCTGVLRGLEVLVQAGQPVVLVTASDIGGLAGLHVHHKFQPSGGVVSIDGVRLQNFEYIDIGAPIAGTGAVPVVVKSLVFPQADHSQTASVASPAGEMSAKGLT